MPNRSTGYGVGVGRVGLSGGPSQGNRGADAIKALTPHNTRPVSLRPGAVLVGTCHTFGTNVLGAIPQAGAGLLSPGEPVREGADPATWTNGNPAGFQGNGWLVNNSGGGGGGGSTIAKFTITSAQILDLVATPVELLPAPGAGKLTVVDFAFAHNAAGTAYSFDGGAGIVWNGGVPAPMPAIQSIDLVGVLSQPDEVTAFGLGDTGTTTTGTPDALCVNQNVAFANQGSTTITLGDTDLVIVMSYHTITIPA